VTGEPVNDWMQREVFEPLGMTHTSYVAAAHGPGTLGHNREGRAFPMSPPAGANVAATLETTARDYARFLIASLGEPKLRAPRGMVSPDLQLGWGLGWGVAGPAPPALLAWGSNPGYKSLAMGIPGSATGFVILTNGDNGLELASALAPKLLGHEYAALEFHMLHPDD
jgi:CubicO group peptidase (beta-lactamase class C family)